MPGDAVGLHPGALPLVEPGARLPFRGAALRPA